jgi:hypothetical protein
VKVFLLAGQSNMEGLGGIRTLDALGEHPTHGHLLKKIKNDDGSFVVRDDVFVYYHRAGESQTFKKQEERRGAVESATPWGKDIPWDWPPYRVPETTVEKLAATMKDTLKANVVRVVGNPDTKVTRVGFACGAVGSEVQIRMLQSENVEVLLSGESPEWETAEYVRDAVAAGKRKAVIFLEHRNSEEAGMEYCAHWLKNRVPEVSVEFLPAGDPFWSPK